MYLLTYKPFAARLMDYLNIVSETGIILFFIVFSVTLSDSSTKTKENVDLFNLIIVNAILLAHIVGTTLYTVNTFTSTRNDSMKQTKVHTVQRNSSLDFTTNRVIENESEDIHFSPYKGPKSSMDENDFPIVKVHPKINSEIEEGKEDLKIDSISGKPTDRG
jgi:hypothetical protein